MTLPFRLEPDDNDYDNSHEQPPWNQPEPEYGEWVETERPEESWPSEQECADELNYA